MSGSLEGLGVPSGADATEVTQVERDERDVERAANRERWSRLSYGYAVTAVVFLLAGGADFLAGRGIDTRLLGALNLASGALWAATALAFGYRTFVTLGLTIAGGLLAAVYGLYYAWQWLRFNGSDPAVLVGALWLVAIGAIGLAIIWRGWRTYRISDDTRRRLSAGRIGIPVLAVAGTFGALFQFWYNETYGPSALPPNLAIDARLVPAGADPESGLRAYLVDVDIRNVGRAKAQVLASLYNVRAIRMAPPDGDYGQAVQDMFSAEPYILEQQPHRSNRRVAAKDSVIVASGELLSRGWYFEPEESSHTQLVTFVDPADGDVLQLSVYLMLARGSRLEIDEQEASGCVTDPAPVDVTTWTSVEPSVVRNFTTADIKVAIGWETADDGTLGFQTCYSINGHWLPAGLEGDSAGALATLGQEYGLTTTHAEAQTTLWPAGDGAALPTASGAP